MATPFKERLGAQRVVRIGDAFADTWPGFDRTAFIDAAQAGLDALELKARVKHIADALHGRLPAFGDAVPILLGTLGRAADPDAPDATSDASGLRGFGAWPVIHYVARFGLDHPDLALDALGEMTGRFSAEFAIRPFLLQHPEKAWAAVDGWASHADVHRRRLASEGTRPRLPWGVRLTPSVADPTRGLSVIDRLVDDDELYVRRSVANHLNDVCKDHPDRALAMAARWAEGATRHRKWVVRHGLRTLLKAADPQALALIGRPPVDVEVLDLSAAESVADGERLPFRVTLHNRGDSPAPVRADYLLHLVKKNGTRRPKAFSLGDFTLAPGERRQLERNHDFKPISTRRYYSGTHRIEVRINGQPGAGVDFELTAPKPG